MGSQFKQRLLMSTTGIFCVSLAIYYSHHFFLNSFFILLTTTIISLALLEYYQLAENKGLRPLVTLGIGSSIAYILASVLTVHDSYYQFIPYFILLISLVGFFVIFFNTQNDPLINMAVTVFGIVYLTIPLTTMLKINYFVSPNSVEHGRMWLAYALVVTKCADVGAYFVGKLFGKHLMAPTLSPKKTIEGVIGGLVLSLLASLFFYHFAFANDHLLTLAQAVWVGLLICVLAQVGDLAESLLKRDAGVKDSSHFPGLGGMLDIMDSLVFTLPLVYLLLNMRILG